MRIAKFSTGDRIAWGLVDGPELVVFRGHPIFQGYETTGERLALKDIQLLPPILPTSKIVCIGKNYADHAAEMGGEAPKEPLIFLKPTTSVIGPEEYIVIPAISNRVDHEGDLAIVIGAVAKDVSLESADDHIWGYTIANDVTARDIQELDGQWTRAKGFDTFCPLGPWIDTDFIPGKQRITASVDGVIKQDAHLSDMIFDISRIVTFVSQVMTLLPGDVILTGTPAGIGPMGEKATVTVAIEGLGELTNKVSSRGR